MNISNAERKQIENEMIFRRGNEQVGTDLDSLDAMHIEEGNPNLIYDDTIVLDFKCECSDEDCSLRLPLRLSDYRRIHAHRSTFIVKPDHQVDEIEDVVSEEDGYNIVVKINSTPEPSDDLNETTINN